MNELKHQTQATSVRSELLHRAISHATELLPRVDANSHSIDAPDPNEFAGLVIRQSMGQSGDTLSVSVSGSDTLGTFGQMMSLVDAFPELAAALEASIDQHVRRALTGVDPVDPLTVAAVVNSVATRLWGDQQLSHRRVYLPIAAEVMRSNLRAVAERELNGRHRTEIMEPVNDHSFGQYAGGAAGAIDRDNHWRRLSGDDPLSAQVFALYRFAGQSVEVIAELLDMPRSDIRARITLADQRVALSTVLK